jgi:hypothetical protein
MVSVLCEREDVNTMGEVRKGNAKLSLLTDRGGLLSCEMLRIPHCPDNGRKVDSLTYCLHSAPQIHYFSAYATHFCSRLSELQGLVQPDGLGKLKKFIHLIGSRTHDLPACSTVRQPLRYCVSPRKGNDSMHIYIYIYIYIREHLL